MDNKGLKLGELLCADGLINSEQLKTVLDLQRTDNRRIGELLVHKGWLDGSALSQSLAKMFGLTFVTLDSVNIDEKTFKNLPFELMMDNKILPLSVIDGRLIVATTDPLNYSALQEIQYKSGYLVNPVLATEDDIKQHLNRFADSLHTIEAIKSLDDKSSLGASVVPLVQSLIARAIKEKASDIHFEPQKEGMRVRFRIDGQLYEKALIPKEIERNVISRIKIMAGMDVAEIRKPQDGRTTLTHELGEFDIRLSTLPDIRGENMVLRILDKQFTDKSFAALGMDQEQIAIMERLMQKPYGLVLVTGPTGVGKTTTLYSMLCQLNQTTRNIISVEDPVEYELAGITQTAINPFIGYTFANAIRHILRHDPDIIMVGEIRDVETAQIAIRAALTGHLVLSTMHTNSATGAITRLLEMDIEPFLISSAIQAVIAQRLIRKVCPACAKLFTPADEILKTLPTSIVVPHVSGFVEPVGCDQCLQTGYQGRTGIFEILEVGSELRALILKSANEAEILRNSLARHFRTLRSVGIMKSANGITALEEALRVTAIE